jgi:hypothetical protein
VDPTIGWEKRTLWQTETHRSVAAQHHQQKAACLVPASSHRTFGYILQLRDLLFAVAPEVAHFDHLGQFGVEVVKCQQCLMNVEDLRIAMRVGVRRGLVVRKRNMRRRTASAFRVGCACFVDDDVAHGFGGKGEEMTFVLNPDLAGADHVEKILVYQVCRAHAMRPSLRV